MQQSSSLLLFALTYFSWCAAAGADDRLVPAEYPTIQAAIDAAADGDDVVVADGVYAGPGNVNLDTQGKEITVRSANGAANCVISGGDVLGDHAFVFDSGEMSNTHVIGFTIEHFHTEHAEPGAIRAISASPALEDLVFRYNTTELGEDGPTVSGSALFVIDGGPVNRFCHYHDNEGAPVFLQSGVMYVLDSLFENNVARGSDGGAAENHGFLLIFFTTLNNNTVIAESGVARGGAVAHLEGSIDLTSCDFEGNSATGPDGALGAAVFLGSDFVVNGNIFRNHVGTHTGGTVAIASATGEAFGGPISPVIENSTVGGLLVDQSAAPLDIHLHSGVFCNNAPYDIGGAVEFFGQPSFCDPGDINGDGTVNEDDRAMLCSALGASIGQPGYLPGADLNNDGEIDHLDQALFNVLLPACDGDLVDSDTFAPPGDGTTDAADLAYLLGEWGDEPSCADFVTSRTFAPPPDGVVDAADLAFLLGAWGAWE